MFCAQASLSARVAPGDHRKIPEHDMRYTLLRTRWRSLVTDHPAENASLAHPGIVLIRELCAGEFHGFLSSRGGAGRKIHQVGQEIVLANFEHVSFPLLQGMETWARHSAFGDSRQTDDRFAGILLGAGEYCPDRLARILWPRIMGFVPLLDLPRHNARQFTQQSRRGRTVGVSIILYSIDMLRFHGSIPRYHYLSLPVRCQRHDVIDDLLASSQRWFEVFLQEHHAISGSAGSSAPDRVVIVAEHIDAQPTVANVA